MSGEQTLVIIGASGDLARRLLLPALAELLQAQPDRRIHLVGAGRTELSDAQWRRRVRDAFREAGAEDAFASVASTPYLAVDATTAPGLRRVIEDAPAGRLVLYFAVPPAARRRRSGVRSPGPGGAAGRGDPRSGEALRRRRGERA